MNQTSTPTKKNNAIWIIIIAILLVPSYLIFSRLSFLAGPFLLFGFFLFLLFLIFRKRKEIKVFSQTNISSPNKPRKTGKIIAIIVIVIICLASGFWLFWKFADNINLDSIKPKDKNGTIVGKIPEGDSDKSVSREIGENGGEISVKTGSGRTAILTIPVGAVKGRRTITVTPVASNNSGNMNNNSGGNNNSNNNSSGNNSGNGNSDPVNEPGIIITPSNLYFDIPAWVSFTWNTSLTADSENSGTSYPDFSSVTSGGTLDLSALKNIGGIPSSVTYGDNKPDKPSSSNSQDKTKITNPGVMVFTDFSGKVTISPAFGGADGSISGPVNGGGATQPKNPDNKEGNNLLENAAAKSGGKCSEEFLLAASRMMKQAVTEEEKLDYSRAIKDCLDIEWLRNLCQNDRIKLRRAYFEQRMPLAMKVDSKIADELKILEEDCIERYEINVSKGNMVSEGIFSMSASLCGYIDDEWSAKTEYKISTAGSVVHNYNGSIKFTLPYTGGSLIPGKAEGKYEVYAAGRRIFSNNNLNTLNITGNFNKDKNTINFILMNGHTYPGAQIKLEPDTSCVHSGTEPSLTPISPENNQGDELPPLVPLVPETDQDDELPPLVPLFSR